MNDDYKHRVLSDSDLSVLGSVILATIRLKDKTVRFMVDTGDGGKLGLHVHTFGVGDADPHIYTHVFNHSVETCKTLSEGAIDVLSP